MDNFKILTYDEEKKLDFHERKEYYTKLKSFLYETKYNAFSERYIKIAEIMNRKIIRNIIDSIKGYDLKISGQENIPNGPVIYASTHQDFSDHFNVVLSIPEHAVIMNTNTVTPLFKLMLSTNGIIFFDRFIKESRFDAKIEAMKCLSKGKSIVVFPEGTYNCSPNKLHLPLHPGIFDMSRKMNVPIVPMVQDYIYDQFDSTIKNVKSCNVTFGTPINVDYNDNIEEKKNELSEQFSKIRYNSWQSDGTFMRTFIRNEEYINYVLSRIDAWSKIKVSIDDERKTIYGADDDFYLFHHINDVAFNELGELIPTEYSKYLEEINEKNLKSCYDCSENKLVLTKK